MNRGCRTSVWRGNDHGGATEKLLDAIGDPSELRDNIIAPLTSFRKLIDSSGPQDAEQNIFGQDIQEAFLAYLLGRSYVGMRVEDIVAWIRFLKTFQASSNKPNELHLVAIGACLHKGSEKLLRVHLRPTEPKAGLRCGRDLHAD